MKNPRRPDKRRNWAVYRWKLLDWREDSLLDGITMIESSQWVSSSGLDLKNISDPIRMKIDEKYYKLKKILKKKNIKNIYW